MTAYSLHRQHERDGTFFNGGDMKHKINDQLSTICGELDIILTNVKTGKIRKKHYKNVFVTFGKNALAQVLAGQVVGDITYCALGTGTTAPAAGDTAMQTEIYRKLISVRSYSGNIATFEIFFTTAEANGSLREAGLFGNGVGRTASSTPGSGQLFCHTAINRTKTTSDTLSIQWTVTIG